jgi:hypothetical protein
VAAALPAALALLLGTAPASHGRLALQVDADGGWASDAWVGAGRGAGAVATVAPAARLDLSVAPWLKLDATGDAAWVRYFGADFGSTSYGGALEARFPMDRVELSARAGGDGVAYTHAAPEGLLAGAPEIRGAAGGDLALACRVRGDTLRGRASATGHVRHSRTADGDVREDGLELAAGLGWSPIPGLALDLDGRHQRVASEDDAFAYRVSGAQLAVRAEALPAALEARVVCGAEDMRFETGLHERIVRAGADLSRAFGPVTAVAGWSWAWNDAPDRLPFRRQAMWVGLRAGGKALTW